MMCRTLLAFAFRSPALIVAFGVIPGGPQGREGDPPGAAQAHGSPSRAARAGDDTVVGSMEAIAR